MTSLSVSGQKRVIRGTVYDEATGETMVGVNIIERNQEGRGINGTITDINGNYMIEISGEPDNDLVFSFISYKAVEIPIKDQSEIEVNMVPKSEQIDEVVIEGQRLTSTGIDNISERDMTGSVSKLEMQEVAGLPATNIGEVLQGRVTGVMANVFSGDPGAGIQVQVRGVSSIMANSEPLYVIDGIPVISSSGDGLSTAGSSPLSDIPPEVIESIEVLKDASAVALWGSRASNGVVIIKTKRGDSNKTTVSYNGRLTYKLKKPGIPMLQGDEYKTLMNEADQNRGSDRYHSEVLNNLRDNIDNPNFELHNNNTNWVNAIEGSGEIHQHSFGLSGGGNAVRYRFSTTFEDNRGPIITTLYQKLNTKFNLDYSVSKRMQIATNISYTNSTQVAKDIKSVTSNSVIVPQNSIQKQALQRAPTWPIYLQDRQGNSLEGQYAFQELDIYNDHTISNPYAFLTNKRNERLANRLLGSIRMVLRPIDHLRLQADLGGDFRSYKDFFFIPPEATGKSPGDELYNAMQLIDGQGLKVYGRFTTNYTRDFNKIHNVNLTAFGSLDMNRNSNIAAGGNNVASSRTPTLSTASSYIGGNPLNSNFNERTLSSVGSRGQYKFLDRYIISGSISVDGSSRFGPDNRYAMFPTLSGKWIVTEEYFMYNAEFLDELAFKYSWGINGNGGISNYTYFSRYSSNPLNSYMGIGGVEAQNIRLDNIRWEKTTQNNAGVTAEMFNRKLSLDFSYYQKYTEDLLQRNIPISSTSGFSRINWYNAGDVLNTGLDFEWDWTIFEENEFLLSFGGNISTLTNRIMKLPELAVSEGQDNSSGGYYWRYIEGDPLGSFYGFEIDGNGVYPHDADAVVRDENNQVVYKLGGYDSTEPFDNAKIMTYGGFTEFEGGDASYKDQNNDGVIDKLDIVRIGDVNPDYYGGFNSTIQYKDFTLNTFFMYLVGKDIINRARMDVEKMYDHSNQAVSVRRRWRKQGDVTDIPKAGHQYKRISGTNAINFLPSNRFIEDGSYLKLQNVTLSYRVPHKKLKKWGLSSWRIFVDAKNILTFTNYSGQDPEVNGGNRIKGVDRALTAPPRMFTLGTSINF